MLKYYICILDKHKGFAFVEYDLEEDAQDALDNMDGSELFGKVLRCNIAKTIPKTEKGAVLIYLPYYHYRISHRAYMCISSYIKYKFAQKLYVFIRTSALIHVFVHRYFFSA